MLDRMTPEDKKELQEAAIAALREAKEQEAE